MIFGDHEAKRRLWGSHDDRGETMGWSNVSSLRGLCAVTVWGLRCYSSGLSGWAAVACAQESILINKRVTDVRPLTRMRPFACLQAWSRNSTRATV